MPLYLSVPRLRAFSEKVTGKGAQGQNRNSLGQDCEYGKAVVKKSELCTKEQIIGNSLPEKANQSIGRHAHRCKAKDRLAPEGQGLPSA